MYTLYEAATIYFAGNKQNWQIIMQSNCAEVGGRRHRAVRAPQKMLYCRQNNKNRNSSKNVTITAEILPREGHFLAEIPPVSLVCLEENQRT